MSTIIFFNIQLVFAKKKLLCYNVYRKEERKNMERLILKKDWKELTTTEWGEILKDVSEVGTKFEYRTFVVGGENVYELVMKNEGKMCGRWAGN